MKFATTILVSCAGALLSLGLVMLYSSALAHRGGGPPVMQLLWCAAGLVVAAGVAWGDYRHLKKASWLLLLIALGLLVAVLVVGQTRNGARRWFEVAGVSFQPSELAKLALIVALAHYGERYQRQMPTFLRGLAIPGATIALVMLLIFLEPDWGTTLLLAAVSGILLLVAGVRWAHLLPWLGVGAAGLVVLLLQNATRLQRVLSWWRPEATREGVGYQAYQAKLALGSGGWLGAGLGSGAHYNYVPENQTDFIFSVLGEELGLICTLGVVLGFVVFVLCGLFIAWNARDPFGLLLATGLTFMVGLQAFINVGVVTGVLPNKGLPLPFISRGGSNLFLMLVSVGLLLSVARCAVRARVEEPNAGLEALPSSHPC